MNALAVLATGRFPSSMNLPASREKDTARKNASSGDGDAAAPEQAAVQKRFEESVDSGKRMLLEATDPDKIQESDLEEHLVEGLFDLMNLTLSNGFSFEDCLERARAQYGDQDRRVFETNAHLYFEPPARHEFDAHENEDVECFEDFVEQVKSSLESCEGAYEHEEGQQSQSQRGETGFAVLEARIEEIRSKFD